jgi:hypothetical protein
MRPNPKKLRAILYERWAADNADELVRVEHMLQRAEMERVRAEEAKRDADALAQQLADEAQSENARRERRARIYRTINRICAALLIPVIIGACVLIYQYPLACFVIVLFVRHPRECVSVTLLMMSGGPHRRGRRH